MWKTTRCLPRDRRQCEIPVMGRIRRCPGLAMAGIVAAFMSAPVGAQVGETVCSCTPRIYNIILDLSKTCDDTGGFSEGILLADCSVIPQDETVTTNLLPVSVSLIDVSELGQNLQDVVGQARFSGNYVTGDTVSYTSNSDVPEVINEISLPKALQLSMIGANADGEELIFSALLAYSNSCTVYPVFLQGARNGWVELREAKIPDGGLCPASIDAPTSVPTLQGPTNAPVVAPTTAPTLRRTSAPTLLPSTPVPTVTASTSPSSTGSLSLIPTILMTSSPIVKPSVAPSAGPTGSSAPTNIASSAPTDIASSAPTISATILKPTQVPCVEKGGKKGKKSGKKETNGGKKEAKSGKKEEKGGKKNKSTKTNTKSSKNGGEVMSSKGKKGSTGSNGKGKKASAKNPYLQIYNDIFKNNGREKSSKEIVYCEDLEDEENVGYTDSPTVPDIESAPPSDVPSQVPTSSPTVPLDNGEADDVVSDDDAANAGDNGGGVGEDRVPDAVDVGGNMEEEDGSFGDLLPPPTVPETVGTQTNADTEQQRDGDDEGGSPIVTAMVVGIGVLATVLGGLFVYNQNKKRSLVGTKITCRALGVSEASVSTNSTEA